MSQYGAPKYSFKSIVSPPLPSPSIFFSSPTRTIPSPALPFYAVIENSTVTSPALPILIQDREVQITSAHHLSRDLAIHMRGRKAGDCYLSYILPPLTPVDTVSLCTWLGSMPSFITALVRPQLSLSYTACKFLSVYCWLFLMRLL